jgi:hypothetical protein
MPSKRGQFANFAGLEIYDRFLFGHQVFAGNGRGSAFRHCAKNQCYSLLRLGRRDPELPLRCARGAISYHFN